MCYTMENIKTVDDVFEWFRKTANKLEEGNETGELRDKTKGFIEMFTYMCLAAWAKTSVGAPIVPVQPLNMPSGLIFYLDRPTSFSGA